MSLFYSHKTHAVDQVSSEPWKKLLSECCSCWTSHHDHLLLLSSSVDSHNSCIDLCFSHPASCVKHSFLSRSPFVTTEKSLPPFTFTLYSLCFILLILFLHIEKMRCRHQVRMFPSPWCGSWSCFFSYLYLFLADWWIPWRTTRISQKTQPSFQGCKG